MFSLKAIKAAIIETFVSISIHVFYPVVIFLALIIWILFYSLMIKSNHIQNQINQSEIQRYHTNALINDLSHFTTQLDTLVRLYILENRSATLDSFNSSLDYESAIAAMLKQSYLTSPHAVPASQASGRKISIISNNVNIPFVLIMNPSEKSLLQSTLSRIDDMTAEMRKAVYMSQGLYADNTGSFSLKGKPDRPGALTILENNNYRDSQRNIRTQLATLINDIDSRVQSEINQLQASLSTIYFLEKFLILFGIILCLYAYFFARYQVLEPLLELSGQAKMILAGNYHVRNHVKVRNEVGDLANTQNRMCESIERDINEHKRMEAVLQTSEESFRNTMENAPIGMAIVSLEGNWLQVNQALSGITGYTKNELYSKTFLDITHPDDIDTSIRLTKKLLQGEIHTFQQEKRYVCKDGRIVWVMVNASLMRDEAGNPINFISQIQDITQRKLNEQRLVELTAQMSSTLNELKEREKEGIMINKMNDLLQVCQDSPEAYSIITMTARELFPQFNGGLAIFNQHRNHLVTVSQWGDKHLLKNAFQSDDCWAIRSGHDLTLDTQNKAVSCKHFLIPPQDGYYEAPLVVQGKLIGLFHLNGAIAAFEPDKQQQLLTSFSEVIKLSLANIQLREALQEQAVRDPLTGLFNRRYLDETLPREFQRVIRENTSLTIAMMDLDNFKRINDTFGHEVGDILLKTVSSLIQQNMRFSDITCRYGGDEFIFVMFQSSLNDAMIRMNELRVKVEQIMLRHLDQPLPAITVSIGIARFPDHGSDMNTLLRAADEALYISKHQGRNQVQAYSPSTT